MTATAPPAHTNPADAFLPDRKATHTLTPGPRTALWIDEEGTHLDLSMNRCGTWIAQITNCENGTVNLTDAHHAPTPPAALDLLEAELNTRMDAEIESRR